MICVVGWDGMSELNALKTFFGLLQLSIFNHMYVHWMMSMSFGKVHRVGHSMKMELIEKDELEVECWVYVGWGW